MGWSCSAVAGNAERRFWAQCKNKGTWLFNGNRYFYEGSRREYDDGSITGSVMRFTLERLDGSGQAVKVGSFKFDGHTGRLVRAPAAMRYLETLTRGS
jgi:hypothetical protein